EEGAPERKDSADALRGELVDHPVLEATRPSILDAADAVPELERPPGHAADGGVGTGCVASAGEDPDSHSDRLVAGLQALEELGQRELRQRAQHQVGVAEVQ